MKSAPQKVKPNPMKQSICESEKTDATSRAVPDANNNIAIRDEASFSVSRFICILVHHRLDLLIALFKIFFMVSKYSLRLSYLLWIHELDYVYRSLFFVYFGPDRNILKIS